MRSSFNNWLSLGESLTLLSSLWPKVLNLELKEKSPNLYKYCVSISEEVYIVLLKIDYIFRKQNLILMEDIR